MKFMVVLLLLASSQAVDLRARKKEDRPSREQSEPKSAVDKRAPAISTVSPSISPGVEYADAKESQQDKSPTHQVYATPLPPAVSKFSDVLAGQGPSFQAAIASHLYAPVSIYQPRLGAPTTYEVSPPVPSNLAYAEHRVALQSPNALQYSQKPHKKFQQIIVQQPAYQQTLGPIYQQVPQIPQLHFQESVNQFQYPYQEPVQIFQSVQPNAYHQEVQSQPAQDVKVQPARKLAEKQIVQNYAQPQGASSFAKFSQLQSTPEPQQAQIQYQAQPQQAQIQYHAQPQQAQIQYHAQPQQAQIQYHAQPQQAQLQYHAQAQQGQVQYHPQPQLAQIQYQPQPQEVQIKHNSQSQQEQIQNQPQPQNEQLLYQPQAHQQPQFQTQQQPQYQQLLQPIQYQPTQQYQILPQFEQIQHPQQSEQIQQHSQLQPQIQAQLEYQPVAKQAKQISYLRPGPVFLQSQAQSQSQSQFQSQSQHNPSYRNNVAIPTYPPVQYFGKYAHSIFGNLQH